jgi:hypothetical protein
MFPVMASVATGEQESWRGSGTPNFQERSQVFNHRNRPGFEFAFGVHPFVR